MILSKLSHFSNNSYVSSNFTTLFVLLVVVFVFFSSVSNVHLFCLNKLDKIKPSAQISLPFILTEILVTFLCQFILEVSQIYTGRVSLSDFNHSSSFLTRISSSFTMYCLLLILICIFHPQFRKKVLYMYIYLNNTEVVH